MISSNADFISLIRTDQCETIIELFVEEDQIRVIFEIGTANQNYFKKLIPPEDKSLDRSDLLDDFLK